MKKRITSILLTLCMLSALPSTAAFSASITNSNGDVAKSAVDSDVTWIGNVNEYKKTLAVFFDNGIRKVAVGSLDKNGNLSKVKYGLIDKSGEWKAQPIYDEIKAYYLNTDNNSKKITEADQEKLTESIFVDGYVQAKRSGKMGLLDMTGKEVIPCNYTSVGLPKEGISRLSTDKYIGYWNLELGKEIVAPNKYTILNSTHGQASGAQWLGGGKGIAYDFKNGYALVNTGKTEKVEVKALNGLYGKSNTYTVDSKNTRTYTLVYAQVIDKNGKEVLPKPYPYLEGTYYPQDGAYLAYTKPAKEMMQLITDHDDHIMFSSHFDTGVVGPKGVVVPAQYHGSIIGNSATGWRLQSAELDIIAPIQGFSTLKSGHIGLREGGAPRGVLNYSNKVLVPFQGQSGTNGIIYNSAYFEAMDGIYKLNGTLIKGTSMKHTDIKKGKNYTGYVSVTKNRSTNGYAVMSKEERTYVYTGSNDIVKNTLESVIDLKNEKSYKINMVYGNAYTEVSEAGTFWVNKDTGTNGKPTKWGLVSLQGKAILPFEYDELKYSEASVPCTAAKKNGKWGLLDKSGKQLLPFEYASISLFKSEGSDKIYFEITDKDNKHGVYSFSEKKITVPCVYRANMSRGSIADTISPVTDNGQNLLVDLETGNILKEGISLSVTPIRGLYAQKIYAKELYGPDGKVVFPTGINVNTFTLVVKGDQVGSINTSYLAGKADKPMPAVGY